MSNSIIIPKGSFLRPAEIPEPSMVPVVFSEEEDEKQKAWEALGELDDIELFFNDVLVLKYVRELISPNIKSSAETQKEDYYVGGVGLVLKLGPRAFVDDENTKFHGVKVRRGDWVMYRYQDGWDRGIQELYGFHKFADCRIIQDAHIRARVKYPGRIMAPSR